MKKVLFTLLLSFILISGFSLGQVNIGDLDIDFCDGSNRLIMSGDTESLTEFCFILYNISRNDGLIRLELVDGEMTLGESPTQACKTSGGGFFTQFVSLNQSGNIQTHSRSGTVYTGTISLPQGFAGDLYGCITMTAVHENTEQGMFNIINRKANLIHISVSGEYVNGLYLSNPLLSEKIRNIDDDTQTILSDDEKILIIIDRKRNRLYPVLHMINSGYSSENYTITGKLEVNIYGQTIYFKEFYLQKSGVLFGGDDITIQQKYIDLPRRALGTIKTQIHISHEPHNIELLTNTYNTDINIYIKNHLKTHTNYIYTIGGLIILTIIYIIGNQIITQRPKENTKTTRNRSTQKPTTTKNRNTRNTPKRGKTKTSSKTKKSPATKTRPQK